MIGGNLVFPDMLTLTLCGREKMVSIWADIFLKNFEFKMKYVPKGLIDTKSPLVHIMVWHQTTIAQNN